MKHAGPASLGAIDALLLQLRALPGLREKQPGVFYRGGTAWLHFHEDGPRLWADVKQRGEWLRLPAGERAHWPAILRAATLP